MALNNTQGTVADARNAEPRAPAREGQQRLEEFRHSINKAAWSSVHEIHKSGFYGVVSNRKWYQPRKRAQPDQEASGANTINANYEYGYRLHFADVHRAHLRYLQVKLINLTTALQFNKDNAWGGDMVPEEIGKTMQQYVQGVRDLEYMTKFSYQSNDPFIASAERRHDCKFLEDSLRDEHIKGKIMTPENLLVYNLGGEKFATAVGTWERVPKNTSPQTIYGTRGAALEHQLISRLVASAIGAVFIVGPMWILGLNMSNVYLQLGCSTGFMVLFGVLVAWYLDEARDVFSATLAYAAVLMVFIGVIVQAQAS